MSCTSSLLIMNHLDKSAAKRTLLNYLTWKRSFGDDGLLQFPAVARKLLGVADEVSNGERRTPKPMLLANRISPHNDSCYSLKLLNRKHPQWELGNRRYTHVLPTQAIKKHGKHHCSEICL